MQKLFATLLFLILFTQPFPTFSAPPPSEVERAKQKAMLEVIGTVENDIMIKDTTKRKDVPTQLRQMTLHVDKIVNNPQHLSLENGKVTIFYSYIPKWNAHEYAGPKRVDISIGDKIHIWLEKRNNQWFPALSGNTIDHLIYMTDRNEPLKEPFVHFISRKAAGLLDNWQQYAPLSTLILLIVILFMIIFWTFYKEKKKRKRY